MKRYNRFDHHMILLGIIIPFLVFFISMNATFAYFTATAAKNESSSETAMLKINFNAATAGEVYTSNGTKSTKILPGDTLKVVGALENSGTADCYVVLEYEIKITKQNSGYTETLAKEYYTLTASGWTEVSGSPGNYSPTPTVFSYESGANSKAISFEHTFDAEEYGNEYKNATVKYSLSANAIQTVNLTTTEAMDILMENVGYSSSKIYGNSIQTVGTGKNLLNPSNNVLGSLNINDGSIHTSIDFVSTSDFIALSAGTYTISYKTGANLRYVAMYNMNKEITGNQWSGRANPYKFTLSSNCLVRIDVERDGNVKIENLKTFFADFEVQLESGSTATEYEPYCGGAPAPTPSNPSEIKSVGERTVNQFYPSNISIGAAQNITVTYDEGSSVYTINGTTTKAGDIWLSNNFKPNIPEGVDVSLQTEILSGSITNNDKYIYYSMFNNSQNSFIRNPGKFLTSAGSIVATGKMLSGDYMKYAIQVGGEGVEFNNLQVRVQLQKGTAATAWEPYGKYKIPLNIQGKNLFNFQELKLTEEASLTGNSVITITHKSNYKSQELSIPASENTSYKMYALIDTTNDSGHINVAALDSSGKTLSTNLFIYNLKHSGTWINFKTPTNTSYLKVSLRNRTLDGYIISNIMITTDLSITEYQPYVGETTIYLDQPLRRVGNVADYIDLETGEVVRKIKSLVLNGTESWENYTASGDISFRTYISDCVLEYQTSLATNYKNQNSAWSDLAHYGIYSDHTSVQYKYFRPPNSEVKTIEAFKTWLQTNPITLIYVTKTEKIEKIEPLGIDFDLGYTITIIN